MKKQIAKIIGESYIEAINNNPVFDEEGDYYKFKNKNVMVVNAKDVEHLQSYKKNRFYHIPKSSLSNVQIGIEYLAFYQPSSKFKEDSGIYYYAKIKDIYPYDRCSCKEFKCAKGKEKDVYIRFELDEFEKLPGISKVQYGVRNVMYTTIYLLKNATTIHEISLKNRKEVEVYKVLKKISMRNSIGLEKKDDGYILGEDYIKVYDNRDIKVNKVLVNIGDLEKVLLQNL